MRTKKTTTSRIELGQQNPGNRDAVPRIIGQAEDPYHEINKEARYCTDARLREEPGPLRPSPSYVLGSCSAGSSGGAPFGL